MKIESDYHSVFCQRLKLVRLAKGLSQKKLGIAAWIDEFVASTRINRYEKGVHEASMEVAQQLADVLQIPLAYFYTADDVLADMMLAFMALSPEEKTKVLALVKNQGIK